mmetsp:Transcript_91635/g.258740  ORF Transcript_91635/g.258740 Transcript_91635/m.258740 type:complete len:86 (+) Transcript_91635:759-1016(+)
MHGTAPAHRRRRAPAVALEEAMPPSSGAGAADVATTETCWRRSRRSPPWSLQPVCGIVAVRLRPWQTGDRKKAARTTTPPDAPRP